MTYQCLEMTKRYLNFEKSIDISFGTKLTFPQISIWLDLDIDRARTAQYLPELYNKINKTDSRFHRFLFDKMIKLLFVLDFNLFSYITRLNDLSIKCFAKVNHQNITCKKPDVLYIYTPDNKLQYISLLNLGQVSSYSSTKISHLRIEVKGLFYDIYINLSHSIFGYYHGNHITSSSLDKYKNNYLVYENSVYRKLSENGGKRCNDREFGLFSDFSLDNKFLDCIHSKSNQSFDCLPINVVNWFRIERDIQQMGYKLCPRDRDINETIFFKIVRNCIDSEPIDCKLRLFDSYFTTERKPGQNIFIKNISERLSKKTTLNIIPKRNLIPRFNEKYRMNLFDLFYNIGCIIGMWIGWSVVSIPTALPNIRKIWFNCFKHLKVIINFTKLVLMRIESNIVDLAETFRKLIN